MPATTTTPTKKKPATRRPSALDRPRPAKSTLLIPRGVAGAASSLRPLHLTIRFVSLPDIELDLAEPHRMTMAALKPLIRAQLMHLEQASAAEMRAEPDPERRPTPPSVLRDAHRRRLRLIYSGKILADDAIVGNVLRPLAPPPSSSASASASRAPGRSASRSPSGDSRTPRIYVNCSIGDVQPESELMDEVMAATAGLAQESEGEGDGEGEGEAGEDLQKKRTRLLNDALVVTHDGETATVSLRAGRDGRDATSPAVARRLTRPLAGPGGGRAAAISSDGPRPSSGRNRNAPSPTTENAPAPSTTPAPRGFDRLAAAGFSTAEVNQLRLQFRSIQATRFTPDAMPSPDTLRSMEDRWLDDSGGAGGLGALGGGGGGTAAGANGADGWDDGALPPEDESGMPGLLDVMVRGMIVGFVYPLGAAAWLGREQGLWTRKWQVFVSFGLILSVMIGTIKTLAGEW